ncbi:hypothetical protein [Natronolimnohabitans innermongolicus]|uniref:PH domain-containing protein n=1 Tax=Natronolimnohabitans innermongolicus JCM 12255 TaxID=1227499 RepID=L9WZZ5_9EURY|nr:hypothetical protein [Natronolimnohabitans innermongolicus]ELY55054.1 hypothetical protein C493_11922 [Natronolimnohabitans innermongolicus JCM 12255]
MSRRNAADAASLEGDDSASANQDWAFPLVAAVYGGVLLAGLTSAVAIPLDGGPLGLSGSYAAGFIAGFVGGFVLARVDARLPARLGRTGGHRLGTAAPSLPFFGIWLVSSDPAAEAVALVSTLLVFATGQLLSQVASNRYVDSVTAGEPSATWRWEPPGSLRLDLLVGALWGVLAAANAATGNWQSALLWLTLGVMWLASGLAEGRWSLGAGRDRCEIQVYDSGLVKRRPFLQTFVSWDEINHVRLRDGELVLDRGFRDVRLERDALEDADGVLEAIDERIAGAALR